MASNTEHDAEIHRKFDRRQSPTGAWAAFFPGGRRLKNRRDSEHCRPYFVDRFPARTLVLIIALLLLSLVDGVITILLLDAGAEEINPVMKYLIDRGLLPFVLGKFVLTAAGIPLLLIFKNYYLFRTRFRVGYLMPIFVGLYFVLIGYQISLLAA